MRKLTWFILAVQMLFLIWIVAGVAGNSDNCAGKVGDALDACKAGTAVGTGLGVGIIIFLWVATDIILGLIWLVTNGRKRECPACGARVKRGVTSCSTCGHDFARAAAGR